MKTFNVGYLKQRLNRRTSKILELWNVKWKQLRKLKAFTLKQWKFWIKMRIFFFFFPSVYLVNISFHISQKLCVVYSSKRHPFFFFGYSIVVSWWEKRHRGVGVVHGTVWQIHILLSSIWLSFRKKNTLLSLFTSFCRFLIRWNINIVL